jgi:cystathionine beta-lyase
MSTLFIIWPEIVNLEFVEYFMLTFFNAILGQEIVAGDDIYGGSDRLLSQVTPKAGIVVKLVWFLFFSFFFVYHDPVVTENMRYLCLAMRRRVNTSDLHEVESAIGPQTKLVWLESPTNPRQQISDIRVRVALFQS